MVQAAVHIAKAEDDIVFNSNARQGCSGFYRSAHAKPKRHHGIREGLLHRAAQCRIARRSDI